MARKATETPPDAGGNITDEAREAAFKGAEPYWRERSAKKAAFDKAHGEWMAHLKLLGEEGHDKKAISNAFKTRDLGEEDRLAQQKTERETAAFLKLMGVPVGTQFGLLDDFEAPSLSVSQARAAGVQAGYEAVDQRANPMTKEEQRRSWNDGWLEGQEKAIKQQAKRAKAQAAAPLPPVDAPTASAGQPNPEQDARDAGRRAGRDGSRSLDNPHPHGSALRAEWEAGWKLGQEDLAFEGPAQAMSATAQ